jgi:hypothetical protein
MRLRSFGFSLPSRVTQLREASNSQGLILERFGSPERTSMRCVSCGACSSFTRTRSRPAVSPTPSPCWVAQSGRLRSRVPDSADELGPLLLAKPACGFADRCCWALSRDCRTPPPVRVRLRDKANALPAQGCVGHNAIGYRRDVLDDALERREWAARVPMVVAPSLLARRPCAISMSHDTLARLRNPDPMLWLATVVGRASGAIARDWCFLSASGLPW